MLTLEEKQDLRFRKKLRRLHYCIWFRNIGQKKIKHRQNSKYRNEMPPACPYFFEQSPVFHSFNLLFPFFSMFLELVVDAKYI